MLKKILGTIGTRYLIAFLNLMLIFMNAKALGVSLEEADIDQRKKDIEALL